MVADQYINKVPTFHHIESFDKTKLPILFIHSQTFSANEHFQTTEILQSFMPNTLICENKLGHRLHAKS